MEVKALGHVVLKVRDLDRSVAFYADVLGLPVVARQVIRGRRMAFFSFTGNHHDLALMETEADAPTAPDAAPGLAHVAFKIGDDLDTLRSALAHLAGRGVVPARLADHHVSQSIYLDDPDGNAIELYVDADPGLWRDNPAEVAHSDPLEL